MRHATSSKSLRAPKSWASIAGTKDASSEFCRVGESTSRKIELRPHAHRRATASPGGQCLLEDASILDWLAIDWLAFGGGSPRGLAFAGIWRGEVFKQEME